MAYPITVNNAATTHASGQTITSAEGNLVSVDVNALTVKVGTGATTPVPGGALVGGATGTSSWAVRDFNVKAFGALGTGSGDDTAAINAAITAAGLSSSTSAVIFFPSGNYPISSQIVVPKLCTVRGTGRGSKISTAAGFPTSTALIRIGDGTGSVGFVEGLTVDCGSVAGSIGVYTDDAQEHGGIRDLVVINYMDAGFRADGTDPTSGACNFHVRDSEFLCSGTATVSVGVDLVNVRTKCLVDNISIVPNTGAPAVQIAGVRVTGSAATDGYAFISNVHTEYHADGVLFGTEGKGYAWGIEARHGTNVVTISSSRPVLTHGLIRTGTTVRAINNTSTTMQIVDAETYSSGATLASAVDTILLREAIGAIAQRNGATGQTQRIYNTTDTTTTNYERAIVGWVSNTFKILVQNGGTGVARDLHIHSANDTFVGNSGTNLTWRFRSNGSLYPVQDNVFDVGAVAGGTNTGRIRNLFMGGSVVMKTKAGAPVDGDFTNPADGMECLDTTNHRHYIRSGGTWKFTQLA